MSGNTSRGYPYPDTSDPFTPSAYIQSLAEAVNDDMNAGYRFLKRVIFTESGTFFKEDYPGLRAVDVQCQGGGGGGSGGRSTTAGNTAVGCGGAGGNWARKWITEDELDSEEEVTVGAGGAGGNGEVEGLFNVGEPGEASSFGNHCRASGGGGASFSTFAGNTPNAGNTFPGTSGIEPEDTGDLIIPGKSGYVGIRLSEVSFVGGAGGDSVLGHGATGNTDFTIAFPATGYGGGGAGVGNFGNSPGSEGLPGGPGVVIVDIYI